MPKKIDTELAKLIAEAESDKIKDLKDTNARLLKQIDKLKDKKADMVEAVFSGARDGMRTLQFPDISNPKPTFNGWLSAAASLDERTSPRETSFLCLFGISIPMALLPGIGANSLTSGVARAYAMS